MKILVSVRTQVYGSRDEVEIEISDEDLGGLTPEERDLKIEEQAREAMFSMIEWNWKEVK